MVESESHSFVIRIWTEKQKSDVSHALWRGHITEVESGEQLHMQSLDDVTSFIRRRVHYLEAPPKRRSWLNRKLHGR